MTQDHGTLILAPNGAAQYIVDCPAGKRVLGGGVIEAIPTVNFFHMQMSGPVSDTSWLVVLVNDTSLTAAAGDVQAYATCAFVAS